MEYYYGVGRLDKDFKSIFSNFISMSFLFRLASRHAMRDST